MADWWRFNYYHYYCYCYYYFWISIQKKNHQISSGSERKECVCVCETAIIKIWKPKVTFFPTDERPHLSAVLRADWVRCGDSEVGVSWGSSWFCLYLQYGFSEWKRHRNQHSRLSLSGDLGEKKKVSRDNQSKFSRPISLAGRRHTSITGGHDHSLRQRLVTCFRSQLFNSSSN